MIKYLHQSLTRAALGLLALMPVALAPAQDSLDEGAKPPVPIAYRPIVLKDARGVPLPLDTRFEWKGKFVTVREATRTLNDLERRANAVGDSLTDRPDATSTQDESRWLQIEARNRAYQKEFPNYRLGLGEGPIPWPQIDVNSLSQLDPAPSSIRADLLAGGTKTKTKTYPWKWRFPKKGSKANIAVEVKGLATFRASKNLAELNYKLTADALLKGKRIPIIGLSYLSDAPAKGKGLIIGNLKVGGYTFWDKNGETGPTVKLADTSYTLLSTKDQMPEIRTKAFGVPIVARIGVEGNVGCRLEGTIRALGAGLIVTPYIEAHGYAEAGIDLGLVEFGIGGEVSLLRYEVPFAASGEARISHNRWMLKVTIDATDTIRCGEGRIYAYVDTHLFKKKKKTLISWEGLNIDGHVIGQQEEWIPL